MRCNHGNDGSERGGVWRFAINVGTNPRMQQGWPQAYLGGMMMNAFTKPMITLLALTTAALFGTAITRASAEDMADPHAQHHMMMPGSMQSMAEDASDPHAHHHHMMMTMPETRRSIVDYKIPDLTLVREDGKRVILPDELNDGRVVVLNFIFTTCTAICPVTSKVFSQLQDKLGNLQGRVHLVSISIDPEHDTPAVLKEYAQKFGARDSWQFYTGTVKDSIAAQQAFGVYLGDKMNHMPVTLLRTAPGKSWVRIDGFATADELLHEFGEMMASK
jgi:protein SCO1